MFSEEIIMQAQSQFLQEEQEMRLKGINFDERLQALLFAKLLLKQTFGKSIVFCSDNEFFISKNPIGYEIAGYYSDYENSKIPFSLTVCKTSERWYPSKQYVAPDTKSCSNSLWLWLIIMLGCTLMGIIMYFLISSSVGI